MAWVLIFQNLSNGLEVERHLACHCPAKEMILLLLKVAGCLRFTTHCQDRLRADFSCGVIAGVHRVLLATPVGASRKIIDLVGDAIRVLDRLRLIRLS